MEITNKHNLPEALVRAAKNDPYEFTGDISTTSLISPPQLYQLRKRHDATISEDVTQRVWSMFGQGLHTVLERSKAPGSLVEERFLAEVSGYVLGGQIDCYEPANQTLYDFKVTKVFNAMGDVKAEWVEQANVNRWLMSKQKMPIQVNRLINVCFLKDWTSFKATGKPQKNGKMYPMRDVVEIELPMWDLSFTEEYIKDRVKKHQEAKLLEDDKLPECTEEDTWNGKRCESWCPVSSICTQNKKVKANA